MAATVGKNGSFRIGATLVTFIDSWSLNMTKDAVDVTAFGNTHRARVAGLRDFSVDFSGTLDRSDASQAAIADQFEDGTDADIGFRLYTTTSASKYWSGSGVATGLRIDSRVGDKVALSGTLQGNGAVAWNT